MDLLFLGTSSATPTRTRNVSGLAVIESARSTWYLVDCGEATQHRLLHTPLSLFDLEAIFITHVHGDHCYGLPGLLASAGLAGRKELLHIIAPVGIEGWIRSTLQETQLFLPFELNFVAVESMKQWLNGGICVETCALAHRVPSYAYSFRETKLRRHVDIEKLVAQSVARGPAWGKLQKGVDVLYQGRTLRSADFVRIEETSQRIVVAGDNDRPELLEQACRQAQVLVHEATYTRATAEKINRRTGHSTAAAVAAFAQSIGLPNLVLTHFSARYQSDAERSPSLEEIRTEAAGAYHGRLFLAEDLARFRLDGSGELSCVV